MIQLWKLTHLTPANAAPGMNTWPAIIAGLFAAVLTVLCVGFPNEMILSSPASAFVYPLMGTRISSDFGTRRHPVLKAKRHHQGIDLAAPDGAPIRAIKNGTIVFADPYAAYGNLVVVMHANGMTSHYGHCQKIRVRTGQKVKAGEIIATVGSTGRVTGPHLHFEIRINGQAHDPEQFIPGLAVAAKG